MTCCYLLDAMNKHLVSASKLLPKYQPACEPCLTLGISAFECSSHDSLSLYEIHSWLLYTSAFLPPEVETGWDLIIK